MSARDVVVDVLLFAGCGLTVLSTCAMLWLGGPRDRLHLLAPVSSLAVPLVAAALVLHNGWGTTSGEIVLIAVLVVLTGPAAGMAVARVGAIRATPEPADGTESPE